MASHFKSCQNVSNAPRMSRNATRMHLDCCWNLFNSKRILLECTSNTVQIFQLPLECGSNAVGRSSEHHRIAQKCGQLPLERSRGSIYSIYGGWAETDETCYRFGGMFIPYRGPFWRHAFLMHSGHSCYILSTFEVHFKYLRCILLNVRKNHSRRVRSASKYSNDFRTKL